MTASEKAHKYGEAMAAIERALADETNSTIVMATVAATLKSSFALFAACAPRTQSNLARDRKDFANDIPDCVSAIADR